MRGLPGFSRSSFFLFLLAGVSSARLFAANAACSVELTLPDNQWQQVGLPCDPGAGNRVADVFGDDLPGAYGVQWAVFGYDPATGYVDLGEDGALTPGKAYWAVQVSGSDQTVDIEGQPVAATRAGAGSDCAAWAGGCIETPLPSGNGPTWSMIGPPLMSSVELGQARVVTASAACGDPQGCSLAEASAANVFHHQLWRYADGGYQALDESSAMFPGDGAWCVTLGPSDQPRLRFPVRYGGFQPADVTVADGFARLDNAGWDETAVRKVLHAFAYGGQATPWQIQAWANSAPETAIAQMLTFEPNNPLLSPPVPGDSADLTKKGGTLRELGAFWSSDSADNDVTVGHRIRYNVAPGAQAIRNDRLWERAVLSHGVNPFRQKVGLWESNYHMAVNLQTAVTDWQILRYYDDIMTSLNDPARGYEDTLTTAALSAAVALQYGHNKNVYRNGECACNEDFAREYHQLFFGILGEDDPDYHEAITIKNTARALTDMQVDYLADIGERADYIDFGEARHWPGALDILHVTNIGSRADERIAALSRVAIAHPESRKYLPVKIIRGLADDNPSSADIAEIRAAWDAMPQKNLLHFLRGYAISRQFHDASRVKYRSSFDRNLMLFTQTVLNNAELNFYDGSVRAYLSENVKLFQPKHNVFGGQTGVEASTSSDIFRLNYNRATQKAWSLARYRQKDSTWRKDWASVIPRGLTNDYQVDKVGEFLWRRYVGDGLKHYGVLERTYVNAFLATSDDWAATVDPEDLDRVFTSAELTGDPALAALREAQASARVQLDDSNASRRDSANWRIGLAINFISATPYVFAQEGR